MHSAHTTLMCQYFALLLFQLMPNLNKSAVILWKCNNPLFAWITLAESKRKKLFGATMKLINDALERRYFGSSIMLKWCKGFSIQLTPSRVQWGWNSFWSMIIISWFTRYMYIIQASPLQASGTLVFEINFAFSLNMRKLQIFASKCTLFWSKYAKNTHRIVNCTNRK